MNNKTQNMPSAEVIDILKDEMTDAATLKLISAIKELEEYYGLQVTNTLSTIDDFINHYHTNESTKRDIKERIEYYENRTANNDVNGLLSYIKEECNPLDIESDALHSQLFEMRMIKKFISDIAVVFALNQPVYDRKREQFTKINKS
ncbi:hypothetical protein [Chryseobacterium bernardetii]|uniref:hypothetical protein n=1 Tax=Chryseobacterium bernardetii TaxID=1241978 RepID=UPI0016285C71|nr:hypothetical protein [Chryseobacterium bernardetii]